MKRLAGESTPQLLIAIFLALTVGGCSRDSSSSTRLLVFPSASLELGNLPAGARYRVRTTVTNPELERVYGFGVVTSCGCLTSDFRPGFLEANSVSPIQVILQIPSSAKPVNESLTFECSSPDLDGQTLRLKAKTFPGFIIHDPADFGLYSSEAGAADSVVIEFLAPSWTLAELDEAIETLKFHSGQPSVELLYDHESVELSIDTEGDQILTIPIRVSNSCFRGVLNNSFFEMNYPGNANAFIHCTVLGCGIPILRVPENGVLFIDPQLLDDSAVASIRIETESQSEQSEIEFMSTTGTGSGWTWTVDSLSGRSWALSVTQEPASGISHPQLPATLLIPFLQAGTPYSLPIRLLPNR